MPTRIWQAPPAHGLRACGEPAWSQRKAKSPVFGLSAPGRKAQGEWARRAFGVAWLGSLGRGAALAAADVVWAGRGAGAGRTVGRLAKSSTRTELAHDCGQVPSTLRPGATRMACAHEPFHNTRTRCVGVLFPVAGLTSAATSVGSEIIEKYSTAEKSNFWKLTVWVFSILSGSEAAHPLTQLNGSF